MNALFGDATSVMPTPETLAEVESLFSATRSPVPSLDIRRGTGHTADGAIPGLDIDPPIDKADGAGPSSPRPRLGSRHGSSQSQRGEGLGGWISNMVARARGDERGEGAAYKPVDQSGDHGGEDEDGENH
jgi:hypothetical protein